MTTGPASSATYAGNGATTIFSTGFYFLENTDVRVTLTTPIAAPLILTEGTHYTLDLPSAVGAAGSIRMVTAPASDASLTIERVVPFAQETDLRTSGQFGPDVHEQALDRLTFQTQQLDRRLTQVEAQGTAGDVVAGNGLAFSGETLSVGEGDGIIVSSDAISVDLSDSPASTLEADQASIPGVDSSVSRSDHRHGLYSSGAEPLELADTVGVVGTEPGIAHEDHVHAHGSRGGGTLHAVATTAAAGFMSAADKVVLDDLASVTASTTFTVTTTTDTVEVLVNDGPVANCAEVYDALVIARTQDGAKVGAWRLQGVCKRLTGSVTEVAAEAVTVIGNESSYFTTPELYATSSFYRLRVTGVLDVPIDWKATVVKTTLEG